MTVDIKNPLISMTCKRAEPGVRCLLEKIHRKLLCYCLVNLYNNAQRLCVCLFVSLDIDIRKENTN